MQVLVTGGAGFIGGHLCRALLRRGDEVTVLDSFDDAYAPEMKRGNLEGLRLRLVEGDLRDGRAVDAALEGADAVVHLAARAGVRESLASPLLYEDVNVRGTLTLLDRMRRRPLPLVFASSSSVYGRREDAHAFTENDDTGRPVSPYAASKRAGELYCFAAHADWGLQTHALRFFTVYGPRQRPSMAIALFLQAALQGQPLPIFGDGSALRDFTFVDDVVDAILAALDRPGAFQTLNVGSGAPIRLDALVDAIERAVGRPVLRHHLPDQPGDVPRTHADVRRAAAVLGWQPRVQMEEGLRRTATAMRAQR
ncbi:MAG: NAD-dependent epimerase/dehydratase family protein [Deltaproteobacteria bacterium]|nr:NAD-dependent epimerase/dehydratase family protein [Deltaproteobacteria bacterium]